MPKRSRLTDDEETPEGYLEPSTSKRRKASPVVVTLVPKATANSSVLHSGDDITHILSWNVETPVPFLDLSTGPKISSYYSGSSKSKRRSNVLRDLITRNQFPDFVCLQEVRARYTDIEWIAALKAAANGEKHDHGPKYELYTSLNHVLKGQRHFGVATLVKDASKVAAAREVVWDSEGRVIILEMKTGWTLINVYALNGSEYPWRDPAEPDKNPTKTRNERKREFNKLLLQECQAMQARGLRIILIGDFNISLTKRDCFPRLRTEYPHGLARKEFNDQFIPRANVVDVFRKVHGEKKEYSWFAQGKPQGTDCARVDFALVDKRLVDQVVETVYLEDPKERAHSDHAPVVLKLKGMSEPPLLDDL